VGNSRLRSCRGAYFVGSGSKSVNSMRKEQLHIYQIRSRSTCNLSAIICTQRSPEIWPRGRQAVRRQRPVFRTLRQCPTWLLEYFWMKFACVEMAQYRTIIQTDHTSQSMASVDAIRKVQCHVLLSEVTSQYRGLRIGSLGPLSMNYLELRLSIHEMSQHRNGVVVSLEIETPSRTRVT
jgi:hypothetical protein